MDITDPRVAAAAGVALIVLALVIYAITATVRSISRRRRNRRNREALQNEKRATLTALIDRIMAGDLSAYREVLDVNNGLTDCAVADRWHTFVQYLYDRDLSERYNLAMAHGERLSNYETTSAKAIELAQGYRGSTSAEARVTYLVDLFGVLSETTHGNHRRVYDLLELTEDALAALLDQAIQARYEELLAQAKAEPGTAGTTAFLLLSSLIDDSRWRVADRHGFRAAGMFDGLPVTPLTRPAGWNELVVRHIENPGITLFERPDTHEGDILHLAAKAEASGDLVEMLLALAYHNRAGRQRSELPDELVASLIREVVAYRTRTKQVTETD